MNGWGYLFTNAMKRGVFWIIWKNLQTYSMAFPHILLIWFTHCSTSDKNPCLSRMSCVTERTKKPDIYDCAQAEQPWWAPLCDKINGCISIWRSQVTVYALLAAPAYCQTACRLNNLKYSLNSSCKSEKLKGKHHVCPVPAWHPALKAQAV